MAKSDDLLAQWREQYAVFKDWLPLAIGIHEQLEAAHPDAPPRDVHDAIRKHVNHIRYVSAVVC